MSGTEHRAGQVVVEMLLVLPVFLGIIFSIMEIGYVSFHVILLNHATYEVARIGGMTCPPTAGPCPGPSRIMPQIIPEATVNCISYQTLQDPQALQMNFELHCTGTHQIKLIFPISSIILSDPGTPGMKRLTAVVAMPIERPLQQ